MMLLGSGVSRGDSIPVNDVKKCTNVVGAPILIIEVIGVFPNVEAKNRSSAFHEWIVLIRRALDDKLSIVNAQPGPATAQPSGINPPPPGGPAPDPPRPTWSPRRNLS